MLTTWLAAWASAYSNSAVLRTVLGFAHVGGLIAAAGAAFMIYRAILRAVRAGSATRGAHLAELEASHPLVVGGLLIVIGSGLLLAGADSRHVPAFEDVLVQDGAGGPAPGQWLDAPALGRAAPTAHPSSRALGRAALVSMILWTLTTLAGAALPNV